MRKVFIAVVICTAFIRDARGQDVSDEARYVHRFAQFAEWPQDVLAPGAPIVNGIVGDDPLCRAIEQVVAGQRANGHLLIVQHLRWNDRLTGCRIIYIGTSEVAHVAAILGATRGFSILTVAEANGFTEHGGMIELVDVEGSVDFDVNTEAVSQAHIRISSKLLHIAHALRSTVEEQ